jgi:lipopolysaccharide export system protein LptA
MISPVAALAQEASVPFGPKADTSLPVEVTAQSLDVDQTDGTAHFVGDVVIIQGPMKLNADKVKVIYDADASKIDRMQARGNVVLVNGPDAAEAQNADYTLESGVVVMTGDVLMTQGPNALSAQRADINLVTGTARMSGRVRTILIPSSNGAETE